MAIISFPNGGISCKLLIHGSKNFKLCGALRRRTWIGKTVKSEKINITLNTDISCKKPGVAALYYATTPATPL
ncbi:MAG: hypothetical protein V3U92_01420, partial [Cellulophaga sp.]